MQYLPDMVVSCNTGALPVTERTGKKSTILGTLRSAEPYTLSIQKNLKSLTSKVLENFQVQMPESSEPELRGA